MPAQTSEKQFQSTIIQAIQARNCLVFHIHDSRRQIRTPEGAMHWVGDQQARGYPDLTIIRRNPLPIWIPMDQKAFWAELKREGQNPNENQVQYLEELPPHRAFLWRPHDFDDADRIIQNGHPTDGRKCPTCWTCWGAELLIRKGRGKQSPKQVSFIERPRTQRLEQVQPPPGT